MSDLTKPKHIDDLLVKNNTPNHLASTLEKQAAAGASIPKHLAEQIEQRHSYGILVKNALQALFPSELLNDCIIAHVDKHRLTIALPSTTAANHMRYLTDSCVQALRAYDKRFCFLEELSVIVTPKTQSSDSRQFSSKKTLSENTKRIINQTATTVITHEGLKQALLRLSND
ncbi:MULTISPECIES: hypothetical protein [unclassified Moraxella]|uniref:hypothetical protein n=1 Tax=unclassified Moraxella TaxID=2685852 RepID=UPI00359D0326